MAYKVDPVALNWADQRHSTNYRVHMFSTFAIKYLHNEHNSNSISFYDT